MTLISGMRLGPYEIVSPLGAGSMGEVYRAHDSRLNRDVAIKILPLDVANNRDRLYRFETEATAAASLNHPNILAVYEMGNHDGAPYIVSELLEGKTLAETLSVISEMLGIPVLDRSLFHEWSRDIASGSDAQQRSRDAHVAIAMYFRELIAERRRRPKSDLLSSLILAEQQGDVLSEAELIDICGLLFVAGHETTANLIGNGMLTLFQHPQELQELREQPSLLPVAVEELLRYDSPIQRAGRVANTSVQFGERTIASGAIVSAMIGSANRDPAQFVDPDRLDIKRRDNCHLAFGAGIRFCLGAMLARAEARIAIGTLLLRMPKLELAGDKVEWRKSVETRGLKKLRVRL